MNDITWIVETNVFFGDYDQELKIVDTIKKLGIKVIPVGWQMIYNEDQIPFQTGPCVFLGSLQLAKKLRSRIDLCESIWCDLKQFDCIKYYPHLREHLLNQDYVILPFGVLPHKKDLLYNALGESNALFIRPCRGDKIFGGKLVYKEHFDKDVEYFGFYDDDPENLVLIARPQNIVNEWRFFVVGKKVITGSQYYDHRELSYTRVIESDPIFSLAQKYAEIWQPEEMFTIDLCETKDGQIKILEIGAFSCSGQYDCDIEKIVLSATEFVNAHAYLVQGNMSYP